MNWQILRALPRISRMKASCVFVEGVKIQKFLRGSILNPKVSSETCYVAAQGKTCEFSEFCSASCNIQGGQGVYPCAARYAGEKQNASSTALAPEGRIKRPTCTPWRFAADNTGQRLQQIQG